MNRASKADCVFKGDYILTEDQVSFILTEAYTLVHIL